jgi:ferredoxin
MVSEFKVRFPGTNFPELTVPEGFSLSRNLDVQNSPILFGCRTGICATCICLLEGALSPPTDDEREVLEIFAPDEPKARLACQVRVDANLSIQACVEG